MNSDLERIQHTYKDILLAPVDELPFTIRTTNCLAVENIKYIGDLVQRSSKELLRIDNLGKKSLREIEDTLAEYNLKLEMKVKDWPPEQIDSASSFVLGEIASSVRHSLNYALRVAATKVHENCSSNTPEKSQVYIDVVAGILRLLSHKDLKQ